MAELCKKYIILFYSYYMKESMYNPTFWMVIKIHNKFDEIRQVNGRMLFYPDHSVCFLVGGNIQN